MKVRVAWLLLVSYLFYTYWNAVFIFLLLGSTLIDYFAAIMIGKSDTQQRKKWYLGLSLLSNVGILFYFKYYHFLRDNFQHLFDSFGLGLQIPDHSWLLPVGISFYTFQTLSYTIDVYRGKQVVEKLSLIHI